MIRCGPAGWSYPDSRGHVYPADAPAKFDALAYLARYFDTIEVNSSFYAPQAARVAHSWLERTAPNENFRFTAKLWQRFTHGPAPMGKVAVPDAEVFEPWTAADVALVTEGMAPLREAGRLGALLAQFPWSFRPSPESTARLERLAADFAGWPVVVEVRHGSWAKRETSLLFKRLGLGFCNIDQPVIGDSLGPTAGATSSVGYVRLHGRKYETWFAEREDHEVSQRYDYLYSAEQLEPWLERILKLAHAPGVTDVYVVANNHFEGKGPANALMLRSMIEKRRVPAPPTLFTTYRESLTPWAEPAQ